jgi:uncharacterized protein DUF4185
VRGVATALLLALVAGCHGAPSLVASATSWPEADALFRSQPRWLGADGAYSIDLGGGRVLWLFGDTFVATSDADVRAEATMPRNTVAIQHGYDPSQATIDFYWATTNGAPDSFFAADGADWLWPAHGIRLGDRLIVFLSRVTSSAGGLGFAGAGWTALSIDNPDADPPAWQPVDLAPPANSFGVTFGSAALDDGEWLYVYGSEDAGSHAVHVLRFADAAARAGDLSHPEWRTKSGWVAQEALTSRPAALFGDAETEFSVGVDARGGFLEVQSIGFGSTTIGLRSAPAVDGPWSDVSSSYRPPESSLDGVLVYAGKGHAELAGADVVATYAANATQFSSLVQDSSLYYPRFVRMTLR